MITEIFAHIHLTYRLYSHLNHLPPGVSDTEEEYRKAFLENNLTGAALASYQDLKNSANAPDTYDTILDAMLLLFPEGKDSDIHRQIVFDRRQKPTESVIEYIDNLNKLARLAYPGLVEASRKDVVMPIFLRGLQPKIREQTKFTNFASIEEAIKSNQYIETQLFKEDIYIASNSINTISNSRNQPENMKTSVAKQCAICEQIDHSANECQYNGLKNPNGAGADADVCCKICGNHTASQCRSPSGSHTQSPGDRRPYQSKQNYRQNAVYNYAKTSNDLQGNRHHNGQNTHHIDMINSVDLEDEGMYLKNIGTENINKHAVAAISLSMSDCKLCLVNKPGIYQKCLLSATCTSMLCPNHSPLLVAAICSTESGHRNEQQTLTPGLVLTYPTEALMAPQEVPIINKPTNKSARIEADLTGYKMRKKISSNAGARNYAREAKTKTSQTNMADHVSHPYSTLIMTG